MGMDTFACSILRRFLLQKLESHASSHEPIQIASLGYQDIICASQMYELWFGEGAIDKLTMRPNTDRLLAIHGRNAAGVEIVPTMESFLELFGNVKVDVIDFQKYQGTEIVWDLGKAIPEKLENKYDIVIDGGTIEHVFNIAQAFHNITKMLKVGGLVYHALPINMINHGFYNISPTLLYDYYGDAGFSFEYFKMVHTIHGNGQVRWHEENPPHTGRFQLKEERGVHLVAKRQNATQEMCYPIQAKYRYKETWR